MKTITPEELNTSINTLRVEVAELKAKLAKKQDKLDSLKDLATSGAKQIFYKSKLYSLSVVAQYSNNNIIYNCARREWDDENYISFFELDKTNLKAYLKLNNFKLSNHKS